MDINFNTDQKLYEGIAKIIHSDTSPVGIDAKKTHILILEKLLAIEERLKNIERQLSESNQDGK